MMIPTVHLNGSSKARLVEGAYNAAKAVRKAIEALEDAAPNARDYYPQGAAAYAQASGEHRDRLRALTRVRDELTALWEGIEEQR